MNKDENETIEQIEIDNLKYKMKSLKNIIDDLTLVVAMYVNDYPFTDNEKIKHTVLMDIMYVVVNAPIDDRKRYDGVLK